MVEGAHHPRNRPPTLGTTSVDFCHYPVTVWAYSTPQPNTEVPAPTGGFNGLSSADITLLEIRSLINILHLHSGTAGTALDKAESPPGNITLKNILFTFNEVLIVAQN